MMKSPSDLDLKMIWSESTNPRCVSSGADLLGGDAAPQGDVFSKARLLQRPAVTDRQLQHPITALRSLKKPRPLTLLLLLPLCECVFV